MKRTRKITYILDPDRRQQTDLARFQAIRDSLPKPPTDVEYEAASASELASMNLVLHANQLVLRILGALRTQGRYDSRDAEQLDGLVREISMRPYAMKEAKRSAGHKTNPGGKPSKQINEKKLLERVGQGVKYEALAAEFKCSIATISGIVKAHGGVAAVRKSYRSKRAGR